MNKTTSTKPALLKEEAPVQYSVYLLPTKTKKTKKTANQEKIKSKIQEMIQEIELILNLSSTQLTKSDLYECTLYFNKIMTKNISQSPIST